MKHRMMVMSVISAGVLALSSTARAQSVSDEGLARSGNGIEIVAGLMDFDLSGTGATTALSIRGTKALTPRLSLQAGATLANPEQQFGSSFFAAPEAHLTYSWRFARWQPFVSGGGGLAYLRGGARDADWRLALSGGGGLKVHLDDRLYVIGEMRLRGLSRDFSATTAEWLGGIGWQLP
jgi:hypothetical protein